LHTRRTWVGVPAVSSRWGFQLTIAFSYQLQDMYLNICNCCIFDIVTMVGNAVVVVHFALFYFTYLIIILIDIFLLH
jgi:hypothetical protein